ncbi:hypothetical protein FIBSPDRAFT_744342 [Athelia psychrophila]|uniref:Uncharacterized protein n=1 Tax=Athelia psychrophila TaxID=1759441 RepID=A0A166HSK4_9AGAM|nr:hypothetical protein FIBSPDRAFT_744342 [Fibularhizoctonia sp. CBS 109695]
MRLALLLVSLSLLQAGVAPAVSDVTANAASPFLDATSSLTSSSSASDVCDRTLFGIVTSCLTTIFLCFWVAVHPNIPGPNQSWMSMQIETFKLIIVTLVVPEWVLAWAIRQFLQAREYTKRLERARNCHSLCLRFTAWTMTHGFLMTMGGFHSYRRGQPMFPLDGDDVLALVKSRSLVPPTAGELRDKSKGGLSGLCIAVWQTLWFGVQLAARVFQNLAITNLEIMTFAYAALSIAMYFVWFSKPLNMRCPVRVKGEKSVKHTRPLQWFAIIDYITGDQDWLIDLSGEERVPTFWSSCRSTYYDGNSHTSYLPLYADIIALSVAMVFGAVHFAAWSFTFPSLEQQTLWRVCAIAITAIPLSLAMAFAVFDPFRADIQAGFSTYVPLICMSLGALLYIMARILLLVLSFATLRQLPLSAYQTVQWTTWIPHV